MSENFPGADEEYDVVDEAGRVIGRATRREVHADPRLIHRAVHVLIFRSDGRLLMQKRVPAKDVEPGKWDTSVGGPVDAGEDWLAAAHRELSEELGLAGIPLQFLYEFKYRSPRESEDVRSYTAVFDGPVSPSAFEIEAAREWGPAEIDASLDRGIFTRSFEEEWRRYRDWRGRGG